MSTPALAAREVSRHKCLIYDGHPSEQLPVVIPFLMDGLQSNWRCLYLGSPEMVQMVDASLADHGVDAAAETERGALILSSSREHVANGKFEPQSMVDSLCTMVDGAVRDGFEGLYATGDMVWELGAAKNFERLLEYEALLEEIFREKPLRGICQYHRGIVPAQAVRDALITHRSMYIGGLLNSDNLFYIPPELLLEKQNGSAAKQGAWMCQQIVRVLKAEQKRDEVLAALRASEAQQRRLSEELAEANRLLEKRVNERTAQLEAANKQLEAFSYSVSHDLRAPLQSILGFSEILAHESGEALGAGGRKRIERVRTSALRMRELIDGMLVLSGALRAELKRAPMDLGAMAEEVVREIREAGPERPAEIIVHKGMNAVGDRVLMRAALTNLIGNAWKFTSRMPSARIEIGKTTGANGEMVFFIKDNGAGFDMKDSEKLFSAFERLHKDEAFPGTGVGLATVQRIVTRHGGRIWAEGHPNHGATFFFTLSS